MYLRNIEILDNSIDQNEQCEVFEEDFIEVVALAKDFIESSKRVSNKLLSHNNSQY